MPKQVYYKGSTEKDLRRIGSSDAKRIMKKLEDFLINEVRSGEALKGQYEGLYKFRAGDYRVVYARVQDGILVLRISHRKDSYRP